jgi:hypothetical protein
VSRDVVRGLRLLILPTLALVAVALFLPGRLELAGRIFALLVCGAALLVLLRALRRIYPPETPLRPRPTRMRKARRPASLVQIEHETALGVSGSFGLHFRLRPRLRAIAAGLLMSRRRIRLDEDTALARAALGDETWELLRPDRRPPEDRLGRGVPRAQLLRSIDALERI